MATFIVKSARYFRKILGGAEPILLEFHVPGRQTARRQNAGVTTHRLDSGSDGVV